MAKKITENIGGRSDAEIREAHRNAAAATPQPEPKWLSSNPPATWEQSPYVWRLSQVLSEQVKTPAKPLPSGRFAFALDQNAMAFVRKFGGEYVVNTIVAWLRQYVGPVIDDIALQPTEPQGFDAETLSSKPQATMIAEQEWAIFARVGDFVSGHAKQYAEANHIQSGSVLKPATIDEFETAARNEYIAHRTQEILTKGTTHVAETNHDAGNESDGGRSAVASDESGAVKMAPAVANPEPESGATRAV
jgi:hypothetical protein